MTSEKNLNVDYYKINSKFMNIDDTEELLHFLRTENEKEIFDLKVGENQSTSKHYQNNNL